jgi:hypothetical protein
VIIIDNHVLADLALAIRESIILITRFRVGLHPSPAGPEFYHGDEGDRCMTALKALKDVVADCAGIVFH